MSKTQISLQDLPLDSAIFPTKQSSASNQLEADQLVSKTDIDSILDSVSTSDKKISDLDKKITQVDSESLKLNGDQIIDGNKTFNDTLSAGELSTTSACMSYARVDDALIGDLTVRSEYDTFAGLMVGTSHSEKDPARDGISFVRMGGTDTDPLEKQGTFVKQVGTIPTKDIKVGVFGQSSETPNYKPMSQLQMVGDAGHNSVAQGWYTFAPGQASHAEGMFSIAGARMCHAEGTKNYILGPKCECAHAEGILNVLSGDCSYTHVDGCFNTAVNASRCHVEGQLNILVSRKPDQIWYNWINGNSCCLSTDKWTQKNYVMGSRVRVDPGIGATFTWSAVEDVPGAFVVDGLKPGQTKFTKGQKVFTLYANGASYGDIDQWEYECLKDFTWNGSAAQKPPKGRQGEGANEFWKPLGEAPTSKCYPYAAKYGSFSINPEGNTLKQKLQHVFIGDVNLWDILIAMKNGTIS